MGFQKALVSLSGGMDSATVLGEAIDQGRQVIAVGFYYGSKHGLLEGYCAQRLANYYGVPFRTIDLSAVMSTFRSALTTPTITVPEGHYEEENMKKTVVPNRNMIFTSILVGLAVSDGCEEIWLGIHAGDRACYPDCRPDYLDAMQRAVLKAIQWEDDDPAIHLIAPFLHVGKKEILERGLALTKPVPYGLTRTCYTDNPISCGRCGSCCERREAFMLLGVQDPLPYAYSGPLPPKPAKV